jgi:hypothetical protein
MRPRFFGQYLLTRGLLTAPQLLAAVEYQQRHNAPLGELAERVGIATRFEVEQIRALQLREDRMFGEAAVKLGILSEDQVAQLLVAQQDAHVHLGDAVATLGYMPKEAVDEALSRFLNDEAQLEPDVVTIPDDLPGRELAFELFYLAHKLLRRAWGLENKTDRLRLEQGPIALSDVNARVPLEGSVMATLFVGVPHAIARAQAARFSGEVEPEEHECNDIVREFANVLCANLRSVLAEQGRTLSPGETELVDSRISLEPATRSAVVTYLTHEGQVLVGLTL